MAAQSLTETATASISVSEMDNQDLQCSICMDTYNQPKVLPCLHSFCKACLTGMVPQKAIGNEVLPTSGGLSPETVEEMDESVEFVDGTSAEPQQVSLREGESIPVTIAAIPFTLAAADGEDDDTAEVVQPRLPDHLPCAELELPSSMHPSLKWPEDIIVCPICKAKHKLPVGGVEKLTDDFELLDRLEKCSLEKSLATKEMKCAECSSDESVEDYCRTCAGALCKGCVRAHFRQRIYADHDIVPNINLTPETFVSPKKRKSCTRHGKEIVFFCLDCKQLICPACVVPLVGGHHEHSFQTLEKVDELYLEDACELIQASETNLKTFHENKDILRGLETAMFTSPHNELLVKRINREFDECIQKLQDRRDHLLAEVEMEGDKLKKGFWSEKEYVEATILKIHSGIKFAQRAQKCANVEERIGMNVQAISRLEEVVGATWTQSTILSPKVFKPCAQQMLASWGKLAVVSDDDITLEIDDTHQPCVCQPLLATVQFCIDTLSDPSVQVLYGKSEQILDPNEVVLYNSQEANCYNVEFVPRVAGKHVLEILIGGVCVARRKFSVKGKLRFGNKVQIGPDWSDEIPEVNVGTVIKSCRIDKRVSVDWGGGNVKDHDWGENDEYEIELVP